jgi:deoxyribose-phosphate aldolase
MDTPAKFIDHTLLKADVTNVEIAALCEEAVEYGFASVCVPPVYVSQASRLLYGSEVAVCTVVGFPLGYQTTEAKVYETHQAIASGAEEIDMVVHLGAVRSSDFAAIGDEIRKIIAASDAGLVKVIIECCLFDAAVKAGLVEVVVESGADYVKTSTGFASAGASLEDVRLLCRIAAGRIKVKAAGGIRDWQACESMLEAGAARIGTSAGVAIMHQWRSVTGLI